MSDEGNVRRLSPSREAAEKRRHRLFDEMWEEWADAARETAVNCFAFHDCYADSDLERLFLIPLMFMRPRWVDGGYGGPLDVQSQMKIWPQFQCGPYRIDFAIFIGPFGIEEKRFQVAVECDGHYFHDRTKEQATRDKSRDRYLTAQGWRVVRFTESEILADPRGCADQVSELIERLLGYHDVRDEGETS